MTAFAPIGTWRGFLPVEIGELDLLLSHLAQKVLENRKRELLADSRSQNRAKPP
jgi:hypothetical protein